MKNLKRALSFALATVMLVGMMVVGAGAADFVDADKIQHTEAVETLVTLGVINGKGDSFDPEGSLTRAEMAKLVVFILHGGKDPVLGTKVTPSFTDIKGHWAESYIEYCSSVGIIAGRGDGTFDPQGTLTGAQAAKMLLVAMNYDPEVFGLTGNKWENNTNVEANKAGLYDELAGMDPSQTITRDQAAQLVYNAVMASTMELTWGQNMSTGAISQNYSLTGNPLFTSKFNGNDSIFGVLESVSYNAVKDHYVHTLTSGATCTTKKDYSDLIGTTVTLLLNTDSSKLDYGMFIKEGSIIASAYASQITALSTADRTIKMAGTTYDMDNASIIVRTYNVPGTTIATAHTAINGNGNIATLIDNDGDDKVDAVVLKPFTVGKITYVGNDTFTFAGGSVKKDDVVLYDGAAKGDVAVRTAAAQTTGTKDVYVNVEYTTGTVAGQNKDGKFQIDGAWYTNSTNTTIAINDTVKFVAFGGVIYVAEVVEASAGTDNLAMIYRAADKGAVGTGSACVEIKLITADGTKSTGILAKINGTAIDDVTDTTTAAGYVGGAVSATDAVDLIGQIVYYEINSDGEYEVKTLPASYNTTKVLGFNGTGAAGEIYDNAPSQLFGSYELADDAVVFYLHGNDGVDNANNNAKVYTGKQVKNTNADQNNGVATFANSLYKTTNGYTYTQVAALNSASTASTPVWLGIVSGTNYGYLTAAPYTTKEGSDTYTNYTMWTANGKLVVKEKKAQTLANFPAGTIVTYDVKSEGVVENVTIMNAATSYVSGFDGEKKVAIAGATSSKIGDETVILYVNTADGVGVEGGVISIADEPTTGSYVNNVRYINGGTEYALIVVDVNNKYEGATVMTTATVAQVNQALKTSNVTINGDLTVGTAVTVPKGMTLTVTGDITATAAISGAGTLVVKGTGSTGYDYFKTNTVKVTADALTSAEATALFVTATPAAGKVIVLSVDTASTTQSTIHPATEAGSISSAAVPAGTYTYYAANSIKLADGSAATHAAGWYTATAVEDVIANG